MTIKELVLEACIAIARKNKHGHMTSQDVYEFLIDIGKSLTTPQQVSDVLEDLNVWRLDVPLDGFRNGYRIHELSDSYWKPDLNPTLTIQRLKYQMTKQEKRYDVLVGRYKELFEKNSKLQQELAGIRSLWRSLNNVMNPGR